MYTSNMKKKGLNCCGFRYQHTYNGKLIEGRGNFVCISTIYDLYFLWVWIGPFSRGSNRMYMYVHVQCTGSMCVYYMYEFVCMSCTVRGGATRSTYMFQCKGM